MNLEIISKFPVQRNQHPPLLLIHGAWHGAWCWENNFLKYFPDKGWEVHALSLRGHGRSEGHGKLRWWSISDYVADVVQVAGSLRRAPILVGHSMGGFIIQKYLEQHSVAGAVLLASIPPSGTLGLHLRILKHHPLIWFLCTLLMTAYPLVKKPAIAREWLLSNSVSDDVLSALHTRLQDESYRALLDQFVLNLPRPSLVKTPITVVGAENDALISIAEVKQTACAYGVEAKVFPKMGHNMMCEPQWPHVAEWIENWSKTLSDQNSAHAGGKAPSLPRDCQNVAG